jgi:hypothetical protein
MVGYMKKEFAVKKRLIPGIRLNLLMNNLSTIENQVIIIINLQGLFRDNLLNETDFQQPKPLCYGQFS